MADDVTRTQDCWGGGAAGEGEQWIKREDEGRGRSKFWERDLIEEELEGLKRSLSHVATVSVHRGHAIISLICNVERTSQILERVSRCLLALLCRYSPRRSARNINNCTQVW